jgi:hypothetical protein
MPEPADDARRFARIYACVLAALAFEIALLWAITRAYS